MGNGLVTLLTRISLILGIAAAVIYPTVNASIQWGQMQTELAANTKAVSDVAGGLKAIVKEQARSAQTVKALEDKMGAVVDANTNLVHENEKLRKAINRNGAVVRDNTQAVDWHSYRIHELEDAEKKGRRP